jgi:hypothetical protein
MLGTLIAGGIFWARGRASYARDVATAAASETPGYASEEKNG